MNKSVKDLRIVILERKAKIELIDHLLDALCNIELTRDGRSYMKKLRAQLILSNEDDISTIENISISDD